MPHLRALRPGLPVQLWLCGLLAGMSAYTLAAGTDAAATCPPPTASAAPLSLTQAVAAARCHDAAYQAAQQAVQAALARVDRGRAALRPSLSLQLGLSQTHSNVNYEQANSSDVSRNIRGNAASVNLTQPIYRAALPLGVRQLELGVRQAELQRDLAAQDLSQRTIEAYFDVLVANNALQSIQAQKAAVAEQLAAARRSFEVGSATITDTYEAQAQFELVRSQEIAAQNDIEVKRAALATLTGRDALRADDLPVPALSTATPPVPPSLEQARQDVLSQNLSLSLQRLQTQLAQTNVEVARAALKPSVDLNASLARTFASATTQAAYGNTTVNRAVSLVLSYPLWDSGANDASVRESLALQSQADNTLLQAQRQSEQSLQQLLGSLGSMQAQWQALQSSERSRALALEANKLGYQVGMKVNSDVLNAQSALFQARRDLFALKSNLLTSYAQLQFLRGLPQDAVTQELAQMLANATSADNTSSAPAQAP